MKTDENNEKIWEHLLGAVRSPAVIRLQTKAESIFLVIEAFIRGREMSVASVAAHEVSVYWA